MRLYTRPSQLRICIHHNSSCPTPIRHHCALDSLHALAIRQSSGFLVHNHQVQLCHRFLSPSREESSVGVFPMPFSAISLTPISLTLHHFLWSTSPMMIVLRPMGEIC